MPLHLSPAWSTNREAWLNEVLWRFWILQQGFGLLLPVLVSTAGRYLYTLIPHRGAIHIFAISSNLQTTGLSPEEAAPMSMGISLFFCDVFAASMLLVCFLQILSLKCCCPAMVNLLSYTVTNLIQFALWVWLSGDIGAQLWRWQEYMHLNLLAEPVWWAAFAVQVVYGLSFLTPALASMVIAARPSYPYSIDEERRPLIVVVERRRSTTQAQRDEAPPNYGT